MNVLSVAEKPSVAKELANIIGHGNYGTRNGASRYNKIYDIPNCEVSGTQARMKITSVLGHVMEMDFAPEIRKWKSCKPEELFDLPIHKNVNKQSEECKRTLVDEARQCNTLLLWLDCDLEGENIAYEVADCCREGNPRIRVLRARFSALIPRDINRAMKYPEQLNSHMNDAVNCRQEIDLRLGAAFTRFLTMRCQHKYDELDGVISYGPCQFPTLGFVVDRYSEIQKFVPSDFWSIFCEYDCGAGGGTGTRQNCSFSWQRVRIFDQMSSIVLLHSCYSESADGALEAKATVVGNTTNQTRKQRPKPLNTVAMQIKSSQYCHISSERAMTAAESLYQKGILSYPRTETDFFADGYELRTIIEEHVQHATWGQFACRLLGMGAGTGHGDNQNPPTQGLFQWPDNGGHDDQAHPPIHPTKCVPLQSLQGDEQCIYELVTRHFLACCSQDAVGNMSKIKIEVPLDGEVFTASGLAVKERNYLDVYRYESWSAHTVPDLAIGQVFTPKLSLTSGKTTSPTPLTEADLIRQMDSNKIGTDATIASHIATIQNRSYVVKDESGRFIPTKLGQALVEAFNNMGYQLNKPHLRAQMESDCQKLARGLIRKEDVLQPCLSSMKDVFLTCVRDYGKLDESLRKHFTEPQRAGGVGNVNRPHEVPNYEVLTGQLCRCGICREAMDLRLSQPALNGNTRRYLHCETCNSNHNLPAKGALSPHAQSCVICSFQVLNVLNVETKKSHTLCPHCYSNPPAAALGGDEGILSDFRCFSCANSECSLSGRSINTPIAPCADMRCVDGFVQLKKHEKGYCLGCHRYPQCKQPSLWLPKCVKSAAPHAEVCTRCSQKSNSKIVKLSLDIKLSLAPPGTPSALIVCPVCDDFWESLHMSGLSLKRRVESNGIKTGGAAVEGNRHQHQQYANIPDIENLGRSPAVGGQPLQYPTFQQSNVRGGSGGVTGMSVAGPGRVQQQQQQQLRTYPPQQHQQQPQQYQQRQHPPPQPQHQQLQYRPPAEYSNNINPPEPNQYNRSFPNNSSDAGYGANSSYMANNQNTNTSYSINNGGSNSRNGYRNENSGYRPTNPNNSMNVGDVGLSELPQCKCGQPSVQRITAKAGANQGRAFFTCGGIGTKCTFFAWVDEASASAGGRGGNDIICSFCKQTGHYARQCPNK